MKLLHCSDLHLGRQLHGISLLEDQAYILEELLTLAGEKGADALLIAGDIYDRSAPSAEAVALLDHFLTQAAERGLPCFLTAGNHDSPERVAYGGTLMEGRGIYLSPLLTGGITPITLEDEYGQVDIFLLPFLRPAHARALWPEEDIGDYTQAVEAVLRHSPVDPSRRQVMVAHQFVVWGGGEPQRSDSEIQSLGGLDQVDGRVFDPFDYVALGHIHGPQQMGRETMRYSGSPLKYSVSEARQKKSAVLVTLGEKGQVDVELCPLTPKRDLRQITGPLDRLVSPGVVSQGNPQDYLHVVLTDLAPVDPMGRLVAVYPNVVRLELCQQGMEPEELDTPVERQDPAELFARFYAQQTGEELDETALALVTGLLREEE